MSGRYFVYISIYHYATGRSWCDDEPGVLQAREKEAAYQERLRAWEGRERRKAKDYDKEKERERCREEEREREAKRLKEFLEDYDDERDDHKYYKCVLARHGRRGRAGRHWHECVAGSHHEGSFEFLERSLMRSFQNLVRWMKS